MILSIIGLLWRSIYFPATYLFYQITCVSLLLHHVEMCLMYHVEMCPVSHISSRDVSHVSSRDVSNVSCRDVSCRYVYHVSCRYVSHVSCRHVSVNALTGWGNEMRSPEERRTAILRLIRWAQHDAVKQDLWCSVRDPFHRGYSGETFLLLFIFFNQTMNLLPRRVLVLLFPGLSCLQDCPVSRTVLSHAISTLWRRSLA